MCFLPLIYQIGFCPNSRRRSAICPAWIISWWDIQRKHSHFVRHSLWTFNGGESRSDSGKLASSASVRSCTASNVARISTGEG